MDEWFLLQNDYEIAYNNLFSAIGGLKNFSASMGPNPHLINYYDLSRGDIAYWVSTWFSNTIPADQAQQIGQELSHHHQQVYWRTRDVLTIVNRGLDIERTAHSMGVDFADVFANKRAAVLDLQSTYAR
jgi:hypothetical protein